MAQAGDDRSDRDPRAVRRTLIAAMAIGLLLLIGAVGATGWINYRIQDHTRWVVHTYQAERDVADLSARIERSEAARRGYLLTGKSRGREISLENAAAFAAGLDAFARLTADNPRQRIRIGYVRQLTGRLDLVRRQTFARVDAGQRSQAIAGFANDGTTAVIPVLRRVLAEIALEERRLLKEHDAELRASVNQFLALIALVAVLIVAVSVAALLTLLRYTRDLAQSDERLRRLNESLEDHVVDRTAGLTRANEEIQRFAYIVSHDLRSPLVNVMGFTSEMEAGNTALAELVDRAEAEAPALLSDEAREAARTDLPEAIGFIRTSTAKMDRLINAILKLSREGRRVITPEALSMDRIVAGIAETLQHRLDERGAEIVVPRALPSIVSDRLAIEQVFGNVIENAVKYLDPARAGRIEVRGRAEGPRAIFEIADNGRGIAAADHARIFDLFRRAGPQDTTGEGIGLAHVRALTYRLGGTIDVVSELGVGATFAINLPIRFAEAVGAD